MKILKLFLEFSWYQTYPRGDTGPLLDYAGALPRSDSRLSGALACFWCQRPDCPPLCGMPWPIWRSNVCWSFIQETGPGRWRPVSMSYHSGICLSDRGYLRLLPLPCARWPCPVQASPTPSMISPCAARYVIHGIWNSFLGCTPRMVV